ncbi:MAG: type II secretion system protein [Planctomycetota bacterium]
MRRRSSAFGFTLIELVAALVLMAMLSVAMMGMVWNLNRVARNAVAHSPRIVGGNEALVREILADDFQNARGWSRTLDSRGPMIILHGLLGRNPVSGTADLSIERVIYRHVSTPWGIAFVRGTASSAGASQILWIGNRIFDAIPLSEGGDPVDSSDLALRGGLTPVPDRLLLRWQDVKGNVVWRQVVRHD